MQLFLQVLSVEPLRVRLSPLFPPMKVLVGLIVERWVGFTEIVQNFLSQFALSGPLVMGFFVSEQVQELHGEVMPLPNGRRLS